MSLDIEQREFLRILNSGVADAALLKGLPRAGHVLNLENNKLGEDSHKEIENSVEI